MATDTGKEERFKVRRIEAIERLAGKVLELKRRVRPRRPIVIEFAGSPKSGKTSAIGSLEIFLRRNGFRTRVLTERASVCPIPNKFDPVFNVWTGCAALNQLMESLSIGSKKIDVIIMDRGFFDTLCWFEWQRTQGLLREADYKPFIDFFTAPRFRMVVDLVLAFESSPKTSIDREYRYLLTRKEGSIMKTDVLTSYRNIIHKTKESYGKMFRDVVTFNTDSKDQSEASYDITLQTLEKLQEIAEERIGYVERPHVNSVSKAVFKYSEIESIVDLNLKYGERSEIERDKDKVQLLPIAVIKDPDQIRLIVARKSEKAVSNRSPERNKILGYFGGHVREEDANFLDAPRSIEVLKQCVYREVKEEIGIDIDPVEVDPWCIWIRDGSKSEQHLAVVFVIPRDLSMLRLNVDGDELVRYDKKGKTGTGEVRSGKNLVESGSLDSWTSNIIYSILNYDATSDEIDQGRLF